MLICKNWKVFEFYPRKGQKTKTKNKWGFSTFLLEKRIPSKNKDMPILYPYGALTICKELEELMSGLWDIWTQIIRIQTRGGQTRVITKDTSGWIWGPKSGSFHIFIWDALISWKILKTSYSCFEGKMQITTNLIITYLVK